MRNCVVIVTFFLQSDAEEAVLNKKRSKKIQKKYNDRKKLAKVEQILEEQFATGRLLGKSSSSVALITWNTCRAISDFPKSKMAFQERNPISAMLANSCNVKFSQNLPE